MWGLPYASFPYAGFFTFTATATQTLTAKASIQSNTSRTIINKGFLIQRRTQTIITKANIFGLGLSIQAKANIKATIIQTCLSKASIKKELLTSLITKARITITYLKTVTAKANIYGIEAVVRRIIPFIEIQWDGVTWTDESDYFLSAQGNEELAGINGEGVASTMDVELDNTNDKFTPDNTLSPLYGYVKIRVPIRVSVIVGTEYKLFTGYIKNIHPNIKTKICSLECYDNQVLVSNKEANGIVYEDKRSDELLVILFKLALGLKDTDTLDPTIYSFDIGSHVVNFGYFEDRNVWPLMGELAVAERGRIFFDRNGILTFWNRERLHNLGVSYTLTMENWITDLDYSVAEHELKNYIVVQAQPRASFGIQVVWSNGNVEYLDPYSDTLVLIPANGSQAAWLELEDPCTTFIQPISGVDYIANSEQDGSGTPLTNCISVTDFTTYGDNVYVNVVNTGNVDAYLTTFQVRANPAQVLKYIRVIARDDTSISLYGKQDETIENHFIQDEWSASEIAYEELWRRQDAINGFTMTIIGIPYLLTGDVVSVEYVKGQFKQAMIDKIDWTLDSGGFIQKLTLIDPYVFPQIQRVDAMAKIGMFFTRTMTAKANIFNTNTKTLTAKADIHTS